MNGSLPGLLTPVDPAQSAGGYFPGLLSSASSTTTTLDVIAPVTIPEPARDPLVLDMVQVTNTELSYGALLSWVDVLANDFTIFADGINPLQLFNNGERTYRVSLVAPKAALSASADTAVNNQIRP